MHPTLARHAEQIRSIAPDAELDHGQVNGDGVGTYEV